MTNAIVTDKIIDVLLIKNFAGHAIALTLIEATMAPAGDYPRGVLQQYEIQASHRVVPI